MSITFDLTGQRFGKLVVQHQVPARIYGHTLWQCVCDCGSGHKANTTKLRRGEVRSCGCARGEHISAAITKHGWAKTPTWASWVSMRRRCTVQTDPLWPYYGGRGITVCDRWMGDFDAFLSDMGPRPPDTSIDRIDNEGNYEPGNCRWATRSEQARNKRDTVLVNYNGKQMPLVEVADLLGISRTVLKNRYRRGWPPERMFLPKLLPHQRIDARKR